MSGTFKVEIADPPGKKLVENSPIQDPVDFNRPRLNSIGGWFED